MAVHLVGAVVDRTVVVGVQLRNLLHAGEVGHAPGEANHGDNHAEDHADREVVGQEGGDDGDPHARRFIQRHHRKAAQRVSIHRGDGLHDHHGHEGCPGDPADNVSEYKDEDREEYTGE